MSAPLRLESPSISGPREIRVGGTTWGIPQGAQVRLVADGALAYVMFEGKLHCLNARGEVVVPESVRRPLSSLLFGGGRR